MVNVRKVTPEEWKEHIEKTIRKQAILEKREKQRKIRSYTRFVHIPILLGIIAIFLMVYLWDWRKLLEHFLSWVIGITIVTTIFAYSLKIDRRK